MFEYSDSIIELNSMDKYNALYEGAVKRQKWFDENNQHSQNIVRSDVSVPFEHMDDYSWQQNQNKESLRSIKYKERISRYGESESIRDDTLTMTQKRIQSASHNTLQLLQERQFDSKALLNDQSQSQIQRFSTSKINIENQQSLDKIIQEQTPGEYKNKNSQKNFQFRCARGDLKHSQIALEKSSTSIEKQFNSIISKFKSKKTDYFKFLLFCNRFKTIMILMLNYLRPSRLTPFQLKMIGDASHGMISHHSGGLHGNCFNIQNIMYKLKFKYGFFHDKHTYQRFQNILIRADKTLYFFVEMGIFLKNLLNCMGTHLPCIDPFSTLFLLWEFFVLLIILHLLFIIPYRVGFVQDTDPTQQYLYLELYFLILDSVLKLNKKTYIEGSFTQDRYKIFKHYLQNEALFDFWSLYVLQLTPNSWWTLFFVIKYPQLSKMINKVKQDLLTSEKLNSLLDLIILLYRLLMFTHIFACLWNWIGIQEQESGSKSWITYYEQDQQSAIDHYISALYFSVVSICTIGYGDITPQTVQERAFTIVMILVSSVFVGYNINSVGLILENLNKQDKQLTDHLRRVNAFMRTHKIDKELQDKTRKAIGNLYLQQEMSKQTNPVDQLEGVSKFLKDEILCNAYMQAVNANAFFQSCSRSFQQKIALQFQEQFYTYEEEIVKQNEEKDYTPTIYYIAQGRVDLYLQIGNTQKIVKSISAGEYFGQQEFFTGANASTLSVKSTDMTYVYYLTLENFLNVAQAFPEDKQLFLHNRDTILYRKDYSVVGVKCWGCESSSHTVNSCPIFFYRYRSHYIHSKINQTQRDFRNNFKRRTPKHEDRHKTLSDLKGIVQAAAYFIEDNNSLFSFLFNDMNLDQQQNEQENSQLSNAPNFFSTGLILEEQKLDKSPSHKSPMHRKDSFNSFINTIQTDGAQHQINCGTISQNKSSLEKINQYTIPHQKNALQVIAEKGTQEDCDTPALMKSSLLVFQNQRHSLNDSQESSTVRQRANTHTLPTSFQQQPFNIKTHSLIGRKKRTSFNLPSDKVLIAYQQPTLRNISKKGLILDKNILTTSDHETNQEIPFRKSNNSLGQQSKIEEQNNLSTNQKLKTLLIQQNEQNLTSFQDDQIGSDVMKAFQYYLCQNSYERVIKNHNYLQLSRQFYNLLEKKKALSSQNSFQSANQFSNLKSMSYYVVEQLSQKNLDELLEQIKIAINSLKRFKQYRSRVNNTAVSIQENNYYT